MVCVELFAGAGGAALGLERAGLEHSALVEWDSAACATLRAAGLGPVVEGDVRDLAACDAERLRALEPKAWELAGDLLMDDDDCDDDDDGDPYAWGLRREALASELMQQFGRVDVLWASPPCPLHSRANSRRRSVAPDGWPWTLAWVDHLAPEWVIVENVAAALAEARGRWTTDLQDRGYAVVSAVLDASDFGVPQRRRRAILMARRGGPVALPEPTHAGRWASMGAALPVLASADDPHLRYFEGRAGSERWRLDRPAPTVTTCEVKGTRASASSGWAFTGGPDRASDAAFLATGRRRLTVEECAALQGFPADWPWQGTREAQYRQVGNAVPPALAEAVGRAVKAIARVEVV